MFNRKIILYRKKLIFRRTLLFFNFSIILIRLIVLLFCFFETKRLEIGRLFRMLQRWTNEVYYDEKIWMLTSIGYELNLPKTNYLESVSSQQKWLDNYRELVKFLNTHRRLPKQSENKALLSWYRRQFKLDWISESKTTLLKRVTDALERLKNTKQDNQKYFYNISIWVLTFNLKYDNMYV